MDLIFKTLKTAEPDVNITVVSTFSENSKRRSGKEIVVSF